MLTLRWFPALGLVLLGAAAHEAPLGAEARVAPPGAVARVAPLDQMKLSQIQRVLLQISNEEDTENGKF